MGGQRTLEISNPLYEANHLRFITVKSAALHGRGDICVYVPPVQACGGALPVVMLLHGVYGSAWSWSLSGGVHLKVNELIAAGELPPMILVMPSDGLWGDGSAYLPHNGYDFEKWIMDDVLSAVFEAIGGANKNSPLFIAGLSMGGFGALRIGAKYGYRFRAIAGLSSITSLPQMKLFVKESLKSYAQANITDEDLMSTFRHYREELPPIHLHCGNDDLLLKYNRELHQSMQAEGIPHMYLEAAGGHDWLYWSRHILDTLNFFAAQLPPCTEMAPPGE